MGGSTTSVEQESALLKAALREVLEPGPGPQDARRGHGRTDLHDGSERSTEPGDRTHPGTATDHGPQHDRADEADHAAGADSCPLCRANRLVHQVAPDLLDEVGRGLDAVGRLLQDLATTVRRHTAEDHPIHRSEREDA